MVRATQLLTGVTIAVFLNAAYLQFSDAFRLGHGSWQMTEWVINYAGGFVRRGITGEMIGWLAAATDLKANLIVVLLSFLIYLVIIAFLIVRARRQVPVFLLLSTVLLGSPAYQTGIVRKDGAAILLLILCLLIAERRWPATPTLILMNLIAAFGVLMHEIFIFVGVPILILLAAGPPRVSVRETGKALVVAALKFTPVLAACVAVTLFSGDAATAAAINASWVDLWRHIEPLNEQIGTPAAAIEALQWDAKRTISLSASLLTRFVGGFIYAPLAWAVTIAVCFWFVLTFTRYTNEGSSRSRLTMILIFQLVAVAPLFVIGWDFGRWIFLWAVSSVAIYLSPATQDLALFNLFSGRFFSGHFHDGAAPRRATSWAWCLLLFGVPTCCWTLDTVVGSMPIGNLILKLKATLGL